MRYRVEYLIQATDEVCSTFGARGDLQAAGWQARVCGGEARRRFGAHGFQIRDLADAGRIVALELFDNPLPCFAPDASHHVVH